MLADLSYDITSTNIFEQLSNKCHDIYTESSPYLDIFGRNTDDHSVFICSICQCIISNPSVQTPCEHYFCAVCLSSYFKFHRSTLLRCPSCQSQIQFTDIRESPRILNVQLQNLDVACSVCGVIGKLQSLAKHSCDVVSQHNCPQKKPRCTVVESVASTKPEDALAEAANMLRKSALQHPHGQPIPLAIEKAADHWTWIKLNQRGKVATLETGGRVSNLIYTIFCFSQNKNHWLSKIKLKRFTKSGSTELFRTPKMQQCQ